jgi:hypothetical protein
LKDRDRGHGLYGSAAAFAPFGAGKSAVSACHDVPNMTPVMFLTVVRLTSLWISL